MSGAYQTRQKKLLLDFFSAHPDQYFSARDMIDAPELQLGEATVYRILARLTEEGVLVKSASEAGHGSLYRYAAAPDCRDHIHLQCVKCGKLSHLDCPLLTQFAEHIQAEHDFHINNSQTVLYGICNRCRGV